MIWHIIRKELLVNLLSLRFLIGLVVIVVVMGIVGYVLVEEYAARNQTYLSDVQLHQQGLENVKVYSLLEVVVDLPPSPLSVFSSGIKDLPSSVRVSPYHIPSMIDEGGGGAKIALSGTSNRPYNPLLRVFTSIDLCFVINMILSLFAIILVFDSFSGEREQGTLKLILSTPTGRIRLLAGKFLGALITVAIPLSIGFLAVMILWSLSPGLSLDASSWTAALLIYIVSLMFLSSFLALSLLMSLFARESSTGLMYLLLVWVVVTIAIPEGGGYLAENFSPQDVRANLLKEADQARREYFKNYAAVPYKQVGGWNNAMTDQYAGESLLGITKEEVYNRLEFNKKIFPMKFRFAEDRYRLVEAYAAALRNWSRMRDNFVRPSLSSLFKNIVQAIAGTDIETYENVVQRARNYREAMMTYLQPKVGTAEWFTRALDYPDVQPTEENMRHWQELVDSQGERAVERILSWDRIAPLDLSALPPPGIRQPGLSERLLHVRLDVILLLGSTIVFLALSAWGVLRYPVR